MTDQERQSSRHPDEFDELAPDRMRDAMLDRALSTYTPAGPRPGLELRLQARMDEALQAPLPPALSGMRRVLSLRWQWAVGSVAAALLVGAIAYAHGRHSGADAAHIDLSTAQVQTPAPPPPVPQQQRASVEIPRRRQAQPVANRRPRVIAVQATARQATARQPSQRELIAQLMAHGPQAIALLAPASNASPEQAAKPIVIEPLPVEPLVTEPIKITPIDGDSAEDRGKL